MKQFFIFLLLFLIFSSCKTNSSENKIKNNVDTISKLPQIDGFFIFKKNMSYPEVAQLLISRKIFFKKLGLNKTDEISYPVSYRYFISPSELKNSEKIKIIEGMNLSILNKNISKFQIGFFNDTIFYFKYEQILEANSTSNSNPDGLAFTRDVKKDIALLNSLSEGLIYKYGYPLISDGDLNAFYSVGTPFFQENNNTHSEIEYIEKQIWLSKDSVMHIFLENVNIIDSSKFEPYTIKTKGMSSIEVLFNNNAAKIIQTNSSKKYDLDKASEKNHLDLTIKQKNKQFDSL